MAKQPDWTGYCDRHAKRLYSSRKLARKQIREHRDAKGLREYPCELVEGHFHIGHKPLADAQAEHLRRIGDDQ